MKEGGGFILRLSSTLAKLNWCYKTYVYSKRLKFLIKWVDLIKKYSNFGVNPYQLKILPSYPSRLEESRSLIVMFISRST